MRHYNSSSRLYPCMYLCMSVSLNYKTSDSKVLLLIFQIHISEILHRSSIRRIMVALLLPVSSGTDLYVVSVVRVISSKELTIFRAVNFVLGNPMTLIHDGHLQCIHTKIKILRQTDYRPILKYY